MSARLAGLVVAHCPRDVDAIALKFDDGPGTVTPAVLTILPDRGARATFNVLGARVRHGAPLVVGRSPTGTSSVAWPASS